MRECNGVKSRGALLRAEPANSAARTRGARRRRTACRAMALLLPLWPANGELPGFPYASEPLPVTGMTEPFRVATLRTLQTARIAAIRFEEGAYVPEGDVVVELEDGAQRARTELAKAAMNTSLPVELERARLDKARRDLDRLKRLQGDDFASSKELSDALAVAEIARVEYDLAVFNQRQATLSFQREKETLAEYFLRAPFPAYLAARLKQPGESADQLEGIVRLVQLDPLFVTVDCPLALAPSVAIGDCYVIRPADPRWMPRTGKVAFASQVADAASQTFRVKLAVDNSDRGWMAGLKVVVDFAVDGVGLIPERNPPIDKRPTTFAKRASEIKVEPRPPEPGH